MKKYVLFILVICTSILTMAGCGKIAGRDDSGKNQIDQQIFKSLVGDYQAEEGGSVEKGDYVGAYWHLFISDELPEESDYYFSIYDNGAGNPGFHGEITNLDEKCMIVKVNLDDLEEMPGNWQHKDGYIEFDYEQKEDKLYLTNHQCKVIFDKEES